MRAFINNNISIVVLLQLILIIDFTEKTHSLLHSYNPSISSLLIIASLPLVSDVRLTDRRSFPNWYAELKINSTFCNVWHLVDPDAPNAPHLLSAEPPEPLTIDQMIEQLNVERNTPLAI